MRRYFVRRLLQTIPTLFGISVVSFVIIHLAPGSPVGMKLNPKMTPETVEKMKKSYDLDKPLQVQYVLWIKKLVTGKLYSFKDGRSVMEKIAERLPRTILLNLVATFIIFGLAVPLGVFSATHQYSFADRLGTLGAYVGLSIPGFWLAYLIILGLVKLGVPVLGMSTFSMGQEMSRAAVVFDRVWHLVLPAVILSIGGIASISRYARSSMLEVVRQDYIRTARAKGLSETDVTYRHALRNALLTVITIFGFWIPGLIGGSLITETVFAYPGVGRMAYESVLSRDYPTVLTLLTISSVLVLFGNLIADLLYAVADPRIRYGSEGRR